MAKDKKYPVMGYMMTFQQEEELCLALSEDIDFRYNNLEYWDQDIISNFAGEHNLEKDKI